MSRGYKGYYFKPFKPHYVATDKGEVYTKLNELVIQFRADIIKEIVMAMEKVNGNPRHKLENQSYDQILTVY